MLSAGGVGLLLSISRWWCHVLSVGGAAAFDLGGFLAVLVFKSVTCWWGCCRHKKSVRLT